VTGRFALGAQQRRLNRAIGERFDLEVAEIGEGRS
jgi:hypothetical protein